MKWQYPSRASRKGVLHEGRAARGEAIYYVKANGTKFIDRFRVRTPTFANLPALLETLKGCQLADVPILILTIDPCISCTER